MSAAATAVTFRNVTFRPGAGNDLAVVELEWPRPGLTLRELRRALAGLRVHVIASELLTVGGVMKERLRICDVDRRLLRGSRLEEFIRGLQLAVDRGATVESPATSTGVVPRTAGALTAG